MDEDLAKAKREVLKDPGNYVAVKRLLDLLAASRKKTKRRWIVFSASNPEGVQKILNRMEEQGGILCEFVTRTSGFVHVVYYIYEDDNGT